LTFSRFFIHGSKIRVVGDDPDVGLFLVPVNNPDKAVKVTWIAENSPSKIVGIVPQTEYPQYRIQIRTQYSASGSTLLKTPRTIESTFTLDAA